MTSTCPRCSSVLLNEGDECETCALAQQEQALEVAASQPEAPRPEVDAFVELESSLKSVRAAREFIDGMLADVKNAMDDPVLVAKLLPALIRATASLGTCTSKLSKEALVWQEKRHKVAQTLSVEDEMVRVTKWFWKKLNVFQMRALLDQIIPLYNERQKKSNERREKRPWKEP